MRFLLILSLLGSILLPSCAGYRLGGVKPNHLSEISSISISQFANSTRDPRVSALATSSVVDALVEDGTYKFTSSESSDAILKGVVKELKYVQLRGDRSDTLRPDELQLRVVIHWTLIENNGQRRVLDSRTTIGHTTFFASANQANSRANATSEGCRDAARRIVSNIANGF